MCFWNANLKDRNAGGGKVKVFLQIGLLMKLETEALMDVTEVVRSGESRQTIAREGSSWQMLQRLPFFLDFSVPEQKTELYMESIQ